MSYKHQWDEFTAYEAAVNAGFKGQEVVALCSYSLGRCDACGVLDVVRNAG